MFHGLMVEKYVNKKLILRKRQRKKSELKPGILDNKIDVEKEA